MAELRFKNKKEVEEFFNQAVSSSSYLSEAVRVADDYNITFSPIENDGENIITADFVLAGKNKHHTVRLQYDGKETGEWSIWCNADADKDTPCNFHQGNALRPLAFKGNIIGFCKHIIGVCYVFKDNIPYITDDMLSEAGVIEKPAKQKQEEPFKELKRFAFKIPVLIEGDRGSGKTYEANAYAKSLGIKPILCGGHSNMESIDLLGCLVPYVDQEKHTEDTSVSAADFFSGDYVIKTSVQNNNRLVWKDGPIAEAFRRAQKGLKTILIIDEILRIPKRELNIFLTALTPLDGQYHLRTGKILNIIDDVAQEETLSCNVDNLFVLATTNVGGQYAVDTIDTALADRFVILRKDTEYDKIISVLENKAKEKKFNQVMAEKAGLFFNKMLTAKEQGLVEENPTLRILVRAFDLAEKEDEVKDYIFDHHLLWVARDVYGKPDKEQIRCIKKIIEDIF